MFTRSIDDKMITNMLPKTFKSMETWDGKELPPEEVFESFYYDYKVLVENQQHGKLGQRLNKEKKGFNSTTKRLFRNIKRKKIDETASFKEQMIKVHKNWGNVEYWQAIKRTAPPYTLAKYLKGMDMYFAADGSIAQVDEDRRIHRILWLRTLEIAFFVTLFCFLMGYPIAHLLATFLIPSCSGVWSLIIFPFSITKILSAIAKIGFLCVTISMVLSLQNSCNAAITFCSVP